MELLTNPISHAVITITILVFSAILHEIAHGLVADRLGDPTARLLGRLTLNPKSHIDPWMSIALPLILSLTSPIIIGGAKPVPVDPMNLRDGRKDLALVSLAGPLTNAVIAILASLVFRLLNTDAVPSFWHEVAIILTAQVIQINILLAIFNLLPIPPLDGSKLFAMLLPEREANAYLGLGSIGIFIIFFLLLTPIGGFSLGNILGTLYTAALSILLR